MIDSSAPSTIAQAKVSSSPEAPTMLRLEMEATGVFGDFPALFEVPSAGFHTQGETLLTHIHQTMTGLILGSA